MKIFIIGASGFLGKNLKIKFSEIGEVETAPSFSISLTEGFDNWLEKIKLRLLNFSPNIIILSGASQTTHDDINACKELIQSNCILPCYIADILISKMPNALFVTFGTSWQYSDSNQYRPFNLYAASKQAGQDLLEHYALRGLRIIQFILFDTYGENDTRRKLLNLLIDSAKNHIPIDTTPGDQEIDLVHIDDVCEGVLNGIDELREWNPVNGVLIRGLGSGKPIIVKELIEKIKIKYGLEVEANIGVRPYRPREVMKTYKNFTPPKGWSPKHNEFRNLK
ncbi:NAD-dependent epimerase/dehydratase family protein [Leptospirillum ferriphilum]|uniref:NAD-dependent epimerase/dehydratase family protein n=1 Tax=Leptospirillum ferriphilum TaxID=178606 RepID=UPI0009DF5A2A|nr:NAD(P)-dependent oxidoreductase [Leptospirillum ferriphilum]